MQQRTRDGRSTESDPLLNPTDTEENSSYDEESRYNNSRLQVTKHKPHFCAVCCTFFSISGILFLSGIGMYAHIGWHYMPNRWTPDEAPVVERNAFTVAGLYCCTMLISMFYWARATRKKNGMTMPGGLELDEFGANGGAASTGRGTSHSGTRAGSSFAAH